jgi:hypothetical protein
MSHQYSLNNLWKAAGEETAVFLEKVEANAVVRAGAATRFFFLLDLVEDFGLSFITSFRILSGFNCRLLFLGILLAHETHSGKLTSDFVYFHPGKSMLLTDLSNLLGFEHSASFVCVAIIIVLPLGLLGINTIFSPFEGDFALVINLIFIILNSEGILSFTINLLVEIGL